jgi:hypothetical protein
MYSMLPWLWTRRQASEGALASAPSMKNLLATELWHNASTLSMVSLLV